MALQNFETLMKLFGPPTVKLQEDNIYYCMSLCLKGAIFTASDFHSEI